MLSDDNTYVTPRVVVVAPSEEALPMSLVDEDAVVQPTSGLLLGVPAAEATADDTPMTYPAMTIDVLRLVIPTNLSSMLWSGFQAISMMFVGQRLGAAALEQFSLGVTVFNVFGLSLAAGVGSAIDTIASQAYGRDRKSPVIGEVLQRSLVLSVLSLAPVMGIFYGVSCVLHAILHPSMAAGASQFLLWSPPYLLGLLLTGAIRRTFLAQNMPHLVM